MASVLVLAGCSLREIDDNIGQGFKKAEQIKLESAGIWGKDPAALVKDINNASTTPIDASRLSQADKDKIERWLTDNDLNRYGDRIGTVYTGGTPLYSEITGNAVERFTYILNKHPELVTLLAE